MRAASNARSFFYFDWYRLVGFLVLVQHTVSLLNSRVRRLCMRALCVLMFERRSVFFAAAAATTTLVVRCVRNVYLNLVTASQSHFALFLMF